MRRKKQITVHCYNKNNRSELMFFYDLYIKTMKKVNANYCINLPLIEDLLNKPNRKVLSHIITKYSDIDYINLGGSHSDTLRQFKKTWGAKDFKYYVFEKSF